MYPGYKAANQAKASAGPEEDAEHSFLQSVFSGALLVSHASEMTMSYLPQALSIAAAGSKKRSNLTMIAPRETRVSTSPNRKRVSFPRGCTPSKKTPEHRKILHNRKMLRFVTSKDILAPTFSLYRTLNVCPSVRPSVPPSVRPFVQSVRL